jgi:hypothetical protein
MTTNQHQEGVSVATSYQRFFHTFFTARGAVEILIVSTLLSFGIGAILALVRRVEQALYDDAVRKSNKISSDPLDVLLTFISPRGLAYRGRYQRESGIATPDYIMGMTGILATCSIE